jgi:hypothetical protein
MGLRSNNSFKPSPLRGLVQVLASFTCPRPQSGPGLTQALDRRRQDLCKERLASAKSFSDPPSPSLRHNSNPLCLRLVSGARINAMFCSFASPPKARRQRSNNSLKPSPLRGLGAGAMIEPSPRPQIGPGLAQALGLKYRRARVEAFGLIGFVFALIALGAANTAKTQVSALKIEIDNLKAAQQNKVD